MNILLYEHYMNEIFFWLAFLRAAQMDSCLEGPTQNRSGMIGRSQALWFH